MHPDQPKGWRHWYHVTLGTYGHWLPGDDRSWRERHHRKHVEGSHKNPVRPSQFSRGLHQHAQQLLKHDPVTFEPADFSEIGAHLLGSLAIQSVPILCISVGEEHCHLLLQSLDDEPRDCAGNLKNHVYHRMFRGLHSPWEKRSHEEPIADYAHGVRAFHYILDHAKEGAWTWSHKQRARLSQV
jgi:hypothetical protein